MLNATTPLMTALWAMPLAGERMSMSRAAGLLLGLAGVLALMLGRGAAFDVQTLLPVLAMPLALLTLPAQSPSATVWAAVAMLALGSTALAYLTFYWLIDKLGATRASSVTYLVPVFGVLWGSLLLAEPVGVLMLLGAVLILCGVLLLGWRRAA